MKKFMNVIVFLFCSSSFASSGSMSTSCSGYVEICDAKLKCDQKYFYLYAYQYAYISNNEVQNENHNFNFSGVLGNSSDYVLQTRVSGNHLIYNGPKFSLAIPWKDANDGVYLSQGSVGPGTTGWKLLCN